MDSLVTSPFGKGGLRGIYLILNPPSPPFSKGGIMGLKTNRQFFVDIDSLSAYASSGTSPERGGPFGAVVFQVAATFRLRFGVRSNPEPHAQAKACGYQLAVNRYRQFFVDIDSLSA